MATVTNHTRTLSSHLDAARATYAVLARRPLGRTGLSVGEVGIGTCALGRGGMAAVPDEEAVFTLGQALDMQACLLDLSSSSAGARAVGLTARAIVGRRHQAQVCLRVAGGPEDIPRDLERVLRALDTDYVDILLWDRPGLEEIRTRASAWDALQGAKRAGKALCVGAAVQGPDELAAAAEGGAADVAQFPLNVFEQSCLGVLAKAAEKGLGLIAARTLDSGWLSGRYGAGHVFFDERRRWSGEDKERRAAYQAAFERAALVPGLSAAQAALRFVLGFPEVSCAVASVSDWHQVVGNVDAARARLEPGTVEALRRLWDGEIRPEPLAP